MRMKKLLTFLTLLTLSIGVSWAGSYTIGFGANDDATTQIQSTTNASTVIKGGGTEYVLAKPFTVNSGVCYYSSKGNVRLGKSKASASLTIALSDKGIVKPISVVVNCHYMDNGNNDDATISVNNLTAQTTTAEYADYTFTFDGETSISSITLASSKSLYVNYITVNYIEETEPPVAPTTAINFDPESGSTVYSGTTVNLSLAVEGGANGIKYTTDGTDPKTYGTEGTSVTLNGNANDVITIKAVPFNTNSNGTTYGTVYTATYTLIEPQATVYRRINNVNDLEVGAKYIILHSPGDESINSNVLAKGKMTDFTRPNVIKEINTTDYSVSVLPTEDIAEFTLGGGENAYTFLCNGKYLSSAASTYLNINGDGTEDDSQWVITFTGNQAYIKAKGQTDTKYISWYNNKNCFNVFQYTNTIYLYKEFQEKAYDVTVTQPEEGGTISASPIGTKVVNAGDKITVTATPATGYELTGWTITGASETEPDANNQITATGDVTITATFSKVDYALTRSSNDLSMGDVKITDADGNILDPQPAAAQAGDVVYFKLTTNYGYQPTSNPVAVTNTTSSTTITVAGPDDESGVYSFTMPAGNVNIAATFQSYHGTLRLAGHFNGNATWRTGNSGPAFTYDNNSDTYTIDAYFTGIDDNGYNDFFFLTLDGVAKHPKADNGNYYISDLNGGEMPFELSGGDKNNFGCAPGVYHIEINGALTSMKFTKQTLNISFDPVAGEVEIGTSVSATSALTALIDNVKAIDNGENGAQGTVVVGVNTDNGNTWNENVTLNTVGNATVYGKAYIGNINATGSATYTVVPVNTSTVYQLVTSTDDLIAGNKYIIVREAANRAMGIQSGLDQTIPNSYRLAEDIVIEDHVTDIAEKAVSELVLGGSTGAWTFMVSDNNRYLSYGVSSPYLVETDAADSDNEKFTITLDGDNNALIENNATTQDPRSIRYNSSVNGRFGLYSSTVTVNGEIRPNTSQPIVQLYKQVDGTITPKCATPVFSYEAGTYEGGLSVAITCATEGATIWYKTTQMETYASGTAPITVSIAESTTLTAYATCDGYTQSNSVEAEYIITIPKVATPVFSPAGGNYTSAQNVTITCETTGAIIYYKENDGEWTEYSAAIPVSEETTIYAKAILTGYADSDIAEAKYTFRTLGTKEFTLVTDAKTQIKAGNEYVILTSSGDYALGEFSTAGSDTNYKGIGTQDFTLEGNIVNVGDDVNIFTLGGDATAGWTFKLSDDSYMIVANSGTTLRTGENNDYAKFSITLTDEKIARIISTATTSRIILYNTYTNNNVTYHVFGNYANSNEGKDGYSGLRLYYREAEPTVPELTLADICKYGVTTEGKNEYIMADKLQAVYAYTKGGNSLLWCKDLDNKSIVPTTIHSGQIDFMRSEAINYDTEEGVHNGQQGPWDQSNWIVLQFTNPTGSNNIDQMLQNAQDKFIKPGTIKGKLVDDVNYILKVDLDQLDLVTQADPDYDEEPYNENVYCPANFLPENLNIDDGIENGDGAETGNQNYFFMNPKVQEICYITYAQWDDYGYFAVPSSSNFSSGIDGAFQVGWVYQDKPALDPGKIYKFHAVVHRVGKEYGPQNPVSTKDGMPVYENITVLPIDLTADSEIVTSINTVETGNGEVKSVKYVNVAGMVSDVPFQGVNIVVTEYSDGSRSTSKMLRK